MTQLGAQIVKVAQDWLAYCKAHGACESPKGANWGGCYTDIQNAFSAGGKGEATCAKFGWLCVSQACKDLGLKNTLPKTAGARDLKFKAATVVPVDTNFQPGNLFYHEPSPGVKSTGHIGVVIEVTPSGIRTIEANHGNCVTNPASSDGTFSYSNAVLARPASQGGAWKCLHVDQIGHTPDVAGTFGSSEAGMGIGGWLLLGGAAYGVGKLAKWW
jgi:hypothetical protein